MWNDRVPPHSQSISHTRALSANRAPGSPTISQGSTAIPQSTSAVSFDTSETVSLVLFANPESPWRQAELSYASETAAAAAARCCFCGSQTIRQRIGEGSHVDISSTPHHRLDGEADTERRGPGVGVALAVTKARCVRARASTALIQTAVLLVRM